MLPGRRAGPAAGIYPRMASLRSLVPFPQVAFASPVVRPVLQPQGLLRSRLFRSCRLRFRRFFIHVFLSLCLLLRLIGFFLVGFCNQPNGLLRCRFWFRLAFDSRLRRWCYRHHGCRLHFRLRLGCPSRSFRFANAEDVQDDFRTRAEMAQTGARICINREI